jgi:23S rRNA (cytosine1962-C5)-methyltransferase
VTATPPQVRLKKPVERHIRGGHPWVFADALRLPKGLCAGDVADLLSMQGDWMARGVVEPDGPISFRVWTTRQDEPVGPDLLTRRLTQALNMRRAVLGPDVTGWRLCHGEGDGVPGLHCDIYDNVASLRTDGALGLAWEARFIEAVQSLMRPASLVVRNRLVDEGKARLVFGPDASDVIIQERDRRFHVDVMAGQKTGFFLDQRDNRDLVGRLAAGRTVLNLFSYTGGFSVAAALMGARRVVSVDIARPAIEEAQRNFTLNQIPLQTHGFEAADVFDVLGDLSKRPPVYDLIVLDPPSFAANQRSLGRAKKAYEALNAMALRALLPDGWLATASCSSHIHTADFLEILANAAQQSGRTVRVVEVRGAGPDHPRRLGFPEGQYLDFVLLHVC